MKVKGLILNEYQTWTVQLQKEKSLPSILREISGHKIRKKIKELRKKMSVT